MQVHHPLKLLDLELLHHKGWKSLDAYYIAYYIKQKLQNCLGISNVLSLQFKLRILIFWAKFRLAREYGAQIDQFHWRRLASVLGQCSC